jgi:hypothetical protein
VRALRRLLSGDESDWDEPALAPAPASADSAGDDV